MLRTLASLRCGRVPRRRETRECRREASSRRDTPGFGWARITDRLPYRRTRRPAQAVEAARSRDRDREGAVRKADATPDERAPEARLDAVALQRFRDSCRQAGRFAPLPEV